ncbi:energy transducer TonB [Sphingobacterium gobiense]|uniref:TonB C-terminal domain-containing protein n=1 Tax=Sphingobacterium gobiense TaxID=1382456 RepID=A0A2S9JKT3_9SPHI|nr:energy transducer TonB [Sphingobacterium gobiense]PRD53742.1 hypothetical protein C5749_09450 [Sphingobacterium gobiense]
MKLLKTDSYKFALLLLYLFSAPLSRAQETIVSYVTKNGGRTVHKDSAEYTSILRIKPNEQGLYELNDYYQNGNLKRHGWVKTLDPMRLRLEGLVETYYDSGSLEATTYYSDNKRIDTAHRYYESGTLKEIKVYLKPQEGQKRPAWDGTNKHLLYYADSTGSIQVQDGNGNIVLPHDNGIDFEQGMYREGLREGRWEGSFRKGKYRFEEWYEKGIVTRGVSTDSIGTTLPYKERDVQPEYPGGVENLRRFAAQHYRYPKEAVRARVKGQVILRFVVDTAGNPTDFEIVNDLGYGTADAGIEMLKKSAKWSPGYQRGVPVRVAYTLPITLNSGPRPPQ